MQKRPASIGGQPPDQSIFCDTDGTQNIPTRSGRQARDLRLQILAVRLHQLGPRVIFELLLAQINDPAGDFLERIERFAGIDSAALRLAGGDRFAPRCFSIGDRP